MDLTFNQNRIYSYLMDNEFSTFDEIAKSLDLPKSTVIMAVQPMKRKGLVKVQKEQRKKVGRPKAIISLYFQEVKN